MSAAAWSLAIELWAHPGIDRRYGEEVTIGEHMLQAAAIAEAEGADHALVVAALLHDVGHLTPPDVGADERNRSHGEVGASMLAAEFPPSVTEPVRLHVAAKRYLVTVDPGYAARLSPASVHTLALQGGPLTSEECRAFEAEPHHGAAVRLRSWDEDGKRADLDVAPLAHYRPMIEALPPR